MGASTSWKALSLYEKLLYPLIGDHLLRIF